MHERPESLLRVEPSAIPRLREAYEQAANDVRGLIVEIRRASAVSQEPWMGDPISQEVAELYTQRFISGPESPLERLLMYGAELDRVRTTLAEMEQRYRQTEGDNVDRWGRYA